MANDEDLARLRQGVAIWNDWRAQNREHNVDLCLAELGGTNLRGADLTDANLLRANLRGADLSNANLLRADLHGADLSNANLRSGANFHEADLSNAILFGADLSETDLSGANLSRAKLAGAHLYKAKLVGANLIGVDLESVDFLPPILKPAKLPKQLEWGAGRVVFGYAGDAVVPVVFTAYHPKEIKLEVWYTLLAYGKRLVSPTL